MSTCHEIKLARKSKVIRFDDVFDTYQFEHGRVRLQDTWGGATLVMTYGKKDDICIVTPPLSIRDYDGSSFTATYDRCKFPEFSRFWDDLERHCIAEFSRKDNGEQVIMAHRPSNGSMSIRCVTDCSDLKNDHHMFKFAIIVRGITFKHGRLSFELHCFRAIAATTSMCNFIEEETDVEGPAGLDERLMVDAFEDENIDYDDILNDL